MNPLDEPTLRALAPLYGCLAALGVLATSHARGMVLSRIPAEWVGALPMAVAGFAGVIAAISWMARRAAPQARYLGVVGLLVGAVVLSVQPREDAVRSVVEYGLVMALVAQLVAEAAAWTRSHLPHRQVRRLLGATAAAGTVGAVIGGALGAATGSWGPTGTAGATLAAALGCAAAWEWAQRQTRRIEWPTFLDEDVRRAVQTRATPEVTALVVRVSAVALLLYLASALLDYRLSLEVKATIAPDATPGFFALFQAGTSAVTLVSTAFFTERLMRRAGPAMAILVNAAVLGAAALLASVAPGGGLLATATVAGVQRVCEQSLGKPGCQGVALPLPDAAANAWRTAGVTLGPRLTSLIVGVTLTALAGSGAPVVALGEGAMFAAAVACIAAALLARNLRRTSTLALESLVEGGTDRGPPPPPPVRTRTPAVRPPPAASIADVPPIGWGTAPSASGGSFDEALAPYAATLTGTPAPIPLSEETAAQIATHLLGAARGTRVEFNLIRSLELAEGPFGVRSLLRVLDSPVESLRDRAARALLNCGLREGKPCFSLAEVENAVRREAEDLVRLGTVESALRRRDGWRARSLRGELTARRRRGEVRGLYLLGGALDPVGYVRALHGFRTGNLAQRQRVLDLVDAESEERAIGELVFAIEASDARGAHMQSVGKRIRSVGLYARVTEGRHPEDEVFQAQMLAAVDRVLERLYDRLPLDRTHLHSNSDPVEFERLLRLMRVPIFVDTPADQLLPIAERTREKSLAEGEFAFHEGDVAAELYVVVHGQIEIRSGESVLARVGPGECFGEIGVLDGRPRSADAVALVPTECLVVDEAVLNQAIEDSPPLARGMIRVLTRRLRGALDLISPEAETTSEVPAESARLPDGDHGQDTFPGYVKNER